MAAPHRRAHAPDLGRARPVVSQGLCLRLSAADPGVESGHHSGLRAPAAGGKGGCLHRRTRIVHRGDEDCSMKMFNFHLMPYRHADLDAIEKNGSAWVTYSNRDYDPEKGAALYHEDLDQM